MLQRPVESVGDAAFPRFNVNLSAGERGPEYRVRVLAALRNDFRPRYLVLDDLQFRPALNLDVLNGRAAEQQTSRQAVIRPD